MRRLSCVLVLIGASTAAAEDDIPPEVRAHAVRRTGDISIDGKLDEAAWSAAPKQSGFVQRFPKDGAKASLETHFAVLYDDNAIYVGVWADDPEPARIRRLLTRRDIDSPADAIMVGIDSYHDRRTAYVFQLNAAGVQRDMIVFDDANMDDTWDAVWTGNASVNDKGWCAEFRIPLNQLRFSGSNSEHEWGLQVVRTVSRTQEQATWSPWPRAGSEVVSRFGIVDGIHDVRPGRRLELLPYATGGLAQEPIDAADPLNDRYSATGGLGLDLKYGLGPAFTLSATINPDFGQVEADPSQVNLSANELFFAEKRPFFLEGVDLFKVNIGNGDNNPEGAFYSRRIGAAPPAPDAAYDYIDAPKATTIYSAMKLTGKTRDGWSVGAFDAVTGQEKATISGPDGMDSPVVAPLTNYAVARVKRDFRAGKTSIGASATAVHRSLDGTGLENQLHDQAYTVGAQLQHRWGKDAWLVDVRTLGSFVHGTPAAIEATQTSQVHLFQRPDATNVHVDPMRTSMTGSGVRWQAGKLGNTKHYRYGVGGDLRSPGLELNDAGLQFQADRVTPYLWNQWHDEDPGDHVLQWQANGDVFMVSTLEPRVADVGIECNTNVQLANYWTLGGGCNIDNGRWNIGALRGGPALRSDPRVSLFGFVNSDNRKPVQVSLFGNGGRQSASDSIDNGFELGVTVQARSNIDVFAGPSWRFVDDAMQYVSEVPDETGKSHFVFARINETVTAMTLRVNWTFSPKLTLQGYAQPFVATGRYSEYKDVDRPDAPRFHDRFTPLDGRVLQLQDGTYHAANNGTFEFDRPDFSFRQLRSTVVARWEYRPGSTVFAIWSHGRTSSDDDGRFLLGHNLGELGDADSENLVMVKANYWIGL